MNETLEELLNKNQIPEEISAKMTELFECLNEEGRAKMLELLARD